MTEHTRDANQFVGAVDIDFRNVVEGEIVEGIGQNEFPIKRDDKQSNEFKGIICVENVLVTLEKEDEI